MRRLVLFVFIIIQAVFFTGAVCGNNLSASKSMACCHDEQTQPMTLHDANGDSCCSHCDMGKNQSALKLQKATRKESTQLVQTSAIIHRIDFDSAQLLPPIESAHRPQESYTSSSPPLFLLDQQFRI
jgi:hypothetical protein